MLTFANALGGRGSSILKRMGFDLGFGFVGVQDVKILFSGADQKRLSAEVAVDKASHRGMGSMSGASSIRIADMISLARWQDADNWLKAAVYLQHHI